MSAADLGQDASPHHSNGRKQARGVTWLAAFWGLALLVTWAAGLPVAISPRAALVNGARPGRGALPLPFAVAIVLLVSGAGPAIAVVFR